MRASSSPYDNLDAKTRLPSAMKVFRLFRGAKLFPGMGGGVFRVSDYGTDHEATTKVQSNKLLHSDFPFIVADKTEHSLDV